MFVLFHIFLQLFPHGGDVGFDSCHLEVIDVDGQEKAFILVFPETFPAADLFETTFADSICAVAFPKESCKWMTVQAYVKENNWTFVSSFFDWFLLFFLPASTG